MHKALKRGKKMTVKAKLQSIKKRFGKIKSVKVIECFGDLERKLNVFQAKHQLYNLCIVDDNVFPVKVYFEIWKHREDLQGV